MKWLPIPIFLPGEFHEQRSLAIGKVMDGKIKGPNIFLEKKKQKNLDPQVIWDTSVQFSR